MATPVLGELTLYAFQLAGLRGTSLVTEHWQSARMAANLLLSDWSNVGPNLWKVDQVQTALVQGQATYDVDPQTIMILDAYMTTVQGNSAPVDRIITPISRSEYASYPIKTSQGFTTSFWFDRLLAPTVTLWPVPDGTSAQYLTYYRVIQMQDAEFASGQTVDIPYRWLYAFAYGMGVELARIWNAAAVQLLQPMADRGWQRAAAQDVENANMYVSPSLSGYWRV